MLGGVNMLKAQDIKKHEKTLKYRNKWGGGIFSPP